MDPHLLSSSVLGQQENFYHSSENRRLLLGLCRPSLLLLVCADHLRLGKFDDAIHLASYPRFVIPSHSSGSPFFEIVHFILCFSIFVPVRLFLFLCTHLWLCAIQLRMPWCRTVLKIMSASSVCFFMFCHTFRVDWELGVWSVFRFCLPLVFLWVSYVCLSICQAPKERGRERSKATESRKGCCCRQQRTKCKQTRESKQERRNREKGWTRVRKGKNERTRKMRANGWSKLTRGRTKTDTGTKNRKRKSNNNQWRCLLYNGTVFNKGGLIFALQLLKKCPELGMMKRSERPLERLWQKQWPRQTRQLGGDDDSKEKDLLVI